ncbi:MAG: NAD(P)-dependent oxidoreductase [Pseudomonadota bacterium]
MSDVLAQDLANILKRSPALWEMLRGRSLFLTGGTGLFGRWLLETLCHANRELGLGLRVTVLTRDAQAFARQAPHLAAEHMLTLHSGDVRDFAFTKGHFDYLIHGATTSASETFNGEDPLRKFDTLVDGTRHVLDFAARCGIERFLFLSSGVAYGTQPTDMTHIPESYQGAPDTRDVDTALGQAKRAAEYLTSYYAHKHGWQNTIARCFSFAGPFLPLDLHYAIGNFIGQALHEDEIVVKGDGSPVRSYLYMADLITWLFTLLLKGENGQIYNVGSDQPISIIELAYLVRDSLSPQKNIRILGQSNESKGNAVRNRYVPNIDKSRQELSLNVWTELDTAIRLTAASSTDLSHRP